MSGHSHITDDDTRAGKGFAEAARRCIAAGYNPLPVQPGLKKPRGKWLRATDQLLAKYWGDGSDNELGIEIPAGSGAAVLDVDCPGEAHSKVKPEAQREVLNILLPLLVEAGLPTEKTPSGGGHYFGRIPTGWQGRSNLGEETGIHILAGRCFVKTYPSKGYITLEESWPVPIQDLPEIPSALLALFEDDPAADKPAKKPQRIQQSAADLEELLRLAPGMVQVNAREYRGHCPLHEDSEPSFRIKQSANGKWYWQCFTKCFYSSIKRGEGFFHGGDAADLRKALRRKEMAERVADSGYYEAAKTAICLQLPEGYGRRLALAIIAVAQSYGLSLQEPVGISYRRIAAKDAELDQVKDNNSRRYKGRHIWKGRRELVAAGAIATEKEPIGGRKNGTTLWNLAPLLMTP